MSMQLAKRLATIPLAEVKKTIEGIKGEELKILAADLSVEFPVAATDKMVREVILEKVKADQETAAGAETPAPAVTPAPSAEAGTDAGNVKAADTPKDDSPKAEPPKEKAGGKDKTAKDEAPKGNAGKSAGKPTPPEGDTNKGKGVETPPAPKTDEQPPQGPKVPLPSDKDFSNVPIMMVAITDLSPSTLNFFKPLAEAKHKELMESIRSNGILNALIVRANVKGKDMEKKYEILAGENRWKVAVELEKETVPVKIVEVDDDKASEILVDSNVAQRLEMTPMELAKAYSEKKRIIGNRQGVRSDLNGTQAGNTRDIIAQEYGKSGMTIDRYLRLENLTPILQEKVDSGELSVKAGMELGLLDKDIQHALFLETGRDASKISTAAITKVKKSLQEKTKANPKAKLSRDEVKSILNEGQGSGGSTPQPIQKIVITLDDNLDPEVREFLDGNDASLIIGILKRYLQDNKKAADKAKPQGA